MAGRRAWRVAAVVGTAVIVALGVLPMEALIRVFAEGDGTDVTVGGHFVGYAVYAFVVAVASGGWASVGARFSSQRRWPWAWVERSS